MTTERSNVQNTSRRDDVAVFQARGIAKVYHIGEVGMHALQGVDLDL